MKKKYLIFLLFVIFSIGCEKEGLEGKKSLIDFIIEPAGENCSNGGYKVISGIDLNNNNILDEDEIENTKYICNGTNGYNSLVNIISEPPGDNCISGGYKVLTGIDLNNNNILDETEIQNQEYICNGIDGANGFNALIKVESEPPGENCSSGGFRILTGLDSNINNILDDSEILNTQYVCNGTDGVNSLFTIVIEEPGDNCSAGGYKINYGIDTNYNGVLDENEIDDIIYICHGENGSGEIETRISLEWWANTTSSTPIMGIGISGFNKDNYNGVDSIVFVGKPYSGNISNYSIVDLYDFTADQVIPGSELRSNKDGEAAEEQFSINLYEVIPSGSRDLGIRLRSEIEGEFSGTLGKCSLYLYRR